VNLLLFTPAELERPLPRGDRRAVHLLRVLRRRAGDTFDAGLVNGPRGKGTLAAIGPEALTLSFAWGAEPPPLDPLVLIIGLPRPQTARDILRDATSLGVAAMHFVATDKSEPSYARSLLWASNEWRRHLLAGAEQAFDTRLPEVTHGCPLMEVIGRLSGGGARVALDNYEASIPLSQHTGRRTTRRIPVVLQSWCLPSDLSGDGRRQNAACCAVPVLSWPTSARACCAPRPR